jgi:hypothetical protein
METSDFYKKLEEKQLAPLIISEDTKVKDSALPAAN